MRKGSSMGGGEFEFNPHKLEEKIHKRLKFTYEKTNEDRNLLDTIGLEYMEAGLGNYKEIRKEILKKLVLELRCI